MERIAYKGWTNNVRLTNGRIELVVTLDVGPRIIRFGYVGGQNLFAEMRDQMGGIGEKAWKIRGGHRLWIAPEVKPLTYELDNATVEARPISGGVRVLQPRGALSHVRRSMDIVLDRRADRVTVTHILRNEGRRAVCGAPWAMSVMARRGTLVVPLPAKVPHTKRLTHNQEWSIWAYTDFTDPRWTLGSRFVLFRQDPRRGPNKLGIAHREGWVAYQLGNEVMVKRFGWVEGAAYPDGGVNFETFSNEDFLEIESLGPLADIRPGQSVRHVETWELHRGVRPVRTEADAERCILPLVNGRGR